MRKAALITAILLLCAAAVAQTGRNNAGEGALITMRSASPLYEIKIMVRAGSAADPAGAEGLARLTAQMLIEGGFGSPKSPVTKEKLAEITRPWGSGALPTVLVDKEATTFTMTVPRDVFPQFIAQVLKPMFTQPLWLAPELDRLRREALTDIQSRLRFEQQELLGLLALDNYIFEGTSLRHLTSGTVKGLQAVTRDGLANFYAQFYNRPSTYVAASISDPAHLKLLRSVIPNRPARQKTTGVASEAPQPVKGRQLLVITQPNAIATGIHFGYPISVKRGDRDYWPLFVGNVALGTHRDEFGRLYQEIRQERGYNYGDYSYVEYLYGRPYFLFPPPTTPRRQQYFSIWVRPVAHQYAHFVTKAATYELERLVREGLAADEVEAAKIKARTLYLNYAESTARQLGYRLDDLFYDMRGGGYIQTMLKSIDAVTPEQVNAAIKKHLQTANLKYVIVTNQSEAEKLADDIAGNKNVVSKTKEEYHIADPVPPEKQKMLARDEQWAAYPLSIPRANMAIVPAERMFETADIPGLSKAAAGGATQ